MSLRDIYSNNEPTTISLHTEPQGNGAGLDNFHTVNPEDRAPNNTGKIVGALAVALMVGAAGIGLYASSGSSTVKPMVSASNAPALPPASASAPQQQAAMTAPVDANTPSTPVQSADAAPLAAKTADAAPVKSVKSIRSAKSDTSTDNMASSLNGDKSQTVVPKQTAAAEPVSPAASPNDVASNTTQSSVAVQPNATSASDIPAAQQQANTATPVAPEQAQPTIQAPAEQAAPAPATEAPAAPAQAQ